MEALKIIEDVTSDSITIKNLSKYKGKKVEIILIPFEEEKQDASNIKKKDGSAYGYLHKYANPDLIEKEKDAWAIAVKDKYGAG
jgi:hypothetical protein